MAKVLRPVLTFEQITLLPDPIINLPERIIETSRPDPNTFMDEHFNNVLKRNAAVAGHAAHTMDTRMAAAEFGVPMDTMRGMQHAAAAAANSAAMGAAPMDTSGNRDLGAASGAAPMDTSSPPPAATATAPAQFDYLGRLHMIEQSMRHNMEIQRQDQRQFNDNSTST